MMATYDFPIPNFRTSTEPGAMIGLSSIPVDASSSWLHSTDDEESEEPEPEGIEADTMKEISSRGLQVPTHPIASMQAAFAESMLEASDASTPSSSSKNTIAGTSTERRQILLGQDVSEDTHATRWRQKPGQKYHELWKLMAQISFGIYLLLNGIAKDDGQVMTILQGHVNEVDEFLESTLEDFKLAQQDIDERLNYLKIPLENIVIFDGMLEDRNYRLQIVNGNEVVEHIITRTAKAMNDALRDVQQGLDACKEFTTYLAEEQEDPIWKEERPEMEKVFEAMKCNVEGWHKAYVSLQTQGNHLGIALVQLGSIVAEMDRRAGEVSRKTRFSTHQSPPTSPLGSPHGSPRHVRQSSRQMRRSMLKELPDDPTLITPAIRATLPAFQLVQDRERTPEPERTPREHDSKLDETSTVSEKLDDPEPEYLLKPRTYSPTRSPQPPAESTQLPQESNVAPKPRNSLRDRFSLKRRETQPQNSPPVPQNVSSPSSDSYWGPRQPVQSHTASNQPSPSLSTPLQTPPSRGLDSAYCSDFERTSPPGTLLPSLVPIPSTPSSHSPSTIVSASPRRIPPPRVDSPPSFVNRDFIPSPHSDNHYFRPVQASPNSPLQRPWTAGPRGSPHNPQHFSAPSSSISSSNLRGLRHAHTPSRLGDRGAAPSAMGMSIMSARTAMTDVTEIGDDGTKRKVKKKRSALGWLKKQFSLSEEEKAAFDERRRRRDEIDHEYTAGGWEKRDPSGGFGGRGSAMGPPSVMSRRDTRWIDGRRVR